MNREGYWYSPSEPLLPMPIPGSPWGGKERFLSQLSAREASSSSEAYRGFSRCRVCGIINGNKEYESGGWCWPSGYRHYLQDHDVRPSLAFQEFILGSRIEKTWETCFEEVINAAVEDIQASEDALFLEQARKSLR